MRASAGASRRHGRLPSRQPVSSRAATTNGTTRPRSSAACSSRSCGRPEAVTPSAHPRRAMLRCARWLLGAATVALALAPLADGRAESVAERGVKAAFVYKFLAYVEWPANAFARADAPIVVGVIGA